MNIYLDNEDDNEPMTLSESESDDEDLDVDAACCTEEESVRRRRGGASRFRGVAREMVYHVLVNVTIRQSIKFFFKKKLKPKIESQVVIY